MAAVTQATTNFLGGVSKQIDIKKISGQVREIENGIADATFGMQKRMGFQFLRTLKKADGSKMTKADLDGAQWFSYQASGQNRVFFGCVAGSQLHIWDSFSGEYFNINPGGTLSDYLTVTNPATQFHFRNIQDTVIISNPEFQPAMQPYTEHLFNREADICLVTIEYGAEYKVFIKPAGTGDFGEPAVFKTKNFDELIVTPDPDGSGDPPPDQETEDRLDAQELLEGLKEAITEKFSVSVIIYKSSLHITSATPIKVKAEGGISGVSIYSFQDAVDNLSRLPPETYPGRKVAVENASGAEDTFYLEYLEKDPDKEPTDPDSERDGVWKECLGFNSSPGLLASRMPHKLTFDGTTFTFAEEEWKPRVAGDDKTVPIPSFCEQDNQGIDCTFFYNNRFGVLCGDFVILSVANDPTNFFATSAVTGIDSDPVDVNVSSTQPTKLFDALPASTGLQLFATREQFLLTGDGSVITPTNAVVRSQSRYEMDSRIPVGDIGVRDTFVAKVPGYTRLFTLQQVGVDEVPAVIDVSKVVANYIPENIDQLATSPQQSLCALTSKKSNEIYLWRYWNNGEQDLFQSWTKWIVPGNIETVVINQNLVIPVTQYADEYCVGIIAVNDMPLQLAPSTSIAYPASPALDMYLTAANRPGLEVVDIYYDAASDKTIFDTPYSPLPDRTAIMVMCNIAQPSTKVATSWGEMVTGFNGTLHPNPEPGVGYYRELEVVNNLYTLRGDWTDYVNNIVVGLKFNYEVELPTIYFNLSQPEKPVYDWTANLTVARGRFQFGASADIKFKLKSKGSEEWVTVMPSSDANYYLANSSPVQEEQTFVLPIHQRNMNFDLKVTSDNPFPTTLVSMMWEGNYSPKSYRRS